jgi:c-di-GMP-binding flagellar brake protein YcgR
MNEMTGKNVFFYSRSLIFNEKFHGVISKTETDRIILHVPSPDVFIPIGTELTVFFLEKDATYAFTCSTLDSKEHFQEKLEVSKPINFFRLKKRFCARTSLGIIGSIFRNEKRKSEPCRIMDLSETGAKISTLLPLDVQDSVKINVEINGKTMSNLPGLVRWKNSSKESFFEYGVEFDLISSVRRKEICVLLFAISHPSNNRQYA